MKVTIFLLVFVFVAAGCVSIPAGELQLGPKIVKDMKENRTTLVALNQGRPIYIEAQVYPQLLEGGDILAGGTVLINLGREEVSLDTIIGPDLGGVGGAQP